MSGINIILPSGDSEWTIYGSTWCGPCKKIKAFMKEKKIDFVYHDVGNTVGTTADALKELTNNYRYIPMVFNKTLFIGGGAATIKFINDKNEQTKNDE
jgi:glutaredoxin